MVALSTSTGYRSKLAAIALCVSLVAASCGPSSSSAQGELVTGAGDPVAGDLIPLLVDPQPSAEVTHDFGTTIEEWAAAEGGSGGLGDAARPSPSDFETLAWQDLMPEGFSGEEIYARYAERFESFEPGSPESNALYDEMLAEFDGVSANPELDGQMVRLAGFVAPLNYEDEIVTEFLLVPNFGACIHVPPPPPNQTVMVTVDKAGGLTTEETWGPVWVEGTLTVATTDTVLAPASYTITSAMSGSYDF